MLSAGNGGEAAGAVCGISFVLPAHNEEKHIFEMVRQTSMDAGATSPGHEIIVVDDGSTDDTAAEVERAAGEFEHVRLVKVPENQGKGYAMRRGFQASRGELVCFIDADMDIHPSQVESLLARMRREDADIVIGSKRHPESRLDYPRIRRIYSTVYYLLILVLFRLPIKDTQTGIKVFRRDVLKRVFPRVVCKQYTLDLELLAVAHSLGFSVAEAPIEIRFQRQYGRIGWRDVRNIIVDTFGIFYRMYVLKYYRSPIKPTVEEEPRISIVIPTRSIDSVTEECIEKCGELNYSNYDIKVVPDMPVDGIQLPGGVKVIPSGPVGPSVKRNMGAGDGDADIVAFIDADAWPDLDWLRNAVPYFEDAGVGAVCGPAVTPASDSLRQQVSGLTYSSSMVSGNTTYRYAYHALREVDDYPSVNLLVRRADFDRAGGYPEEYWPGEDTVLCLRLTRDLGKRIVYVPNVVVYHHRRAVYLPHLKQVYAYAVHRGFFVRAFPETSRRLQFFVPSLFVVGLVVGFVASLFSRPIRCAYLSVVGLYGLLSMLSSIKTLSPAVNLMVFPGIIATNVTYGIGFLRGLFSRRMTEE
jgi:cellulose synthase/poly-beta-1,6-N-acetylglucosamine synthase-like glycosyltransferase